MKTYKTITTYLLSMVVMIASVGFVYHTINNASAAITDCTTTVGNLVQNCSFENPAGPIGGHINPNQDVLDNGDASITNWPTFDDGGKQGNVGTIFNNDAIYVSAQGDRLVDVSGHTYAADYVEKSGMGIQQTITGLTVGKTYEIIFSQGYSPLLQPSKVTVLIDGTPSTEGVGGFNVNNTTSGTTNFGTTLAPFIPFTIKWKEQRTTFVATATSAVIGFRGEVTQVGRGDFIDNIIMKEVVDTTAPILTLSPATTTVSGPFTVTVCTSEPLATTPVSATLELTDFNVTNGTASGLSGPTIGPSCPGGEIYTVTITPTIVVDGTITVSVPSGAATDPTGNLSTTANTVVATYDIVTVIISPVHIQTDNGINNQYGTTGNIVTLTYTTDIDVSTAGTHTVTIGGQSVTPSCVGVGPSTCTATLPITAIVPMSDGLLSFSIVVDSQTTTATTDGSSVTVDRTINVVINTPVVGDNLSTFLIGGQCEIGAGNVTLSGSGFSPSPVTTPCDAFGYFEYEPVTGTPGTITITATQTDLAGNVGTDTNVYILAVPTLPVVTISGPLGNASTGSNTITGTCTTSAGNVTISGTGFTPSPGTAICVGGIYSYPITVTGNTTFTASQTNGAGTAIATGSTIVPTTTTSGGGGCLPGYSCFSNTPSTPTNSSSVVITNTTTPVVSTDTNRCPAFTQYLKKGMRDGRNGVSEISKVQSFLNGKLGLNLTVDGIFGSRTHSAVRNFQTTYSSQILNPWSLIGPTGWWYQSTRSYANYLEDCSEGTVRLDNGIQIRDGSIQ